MPKIILIETSTALCSTAIAEDGKILCRRESSTPRSHASLTAVFIKEMIDELGIKVSGCDAVCVSSGPGSYTGLRVGSSSAKGLCFGAGLPLIAVCTLDVLVSQAICDGLLPEGCRRVIPMIDARRMEVYSGVYEISEDGSFKRKTPIEPVIVENGSFSGELSQGPVLFIGDGTEKCRETLGVNPNAYFAQACPRADAMARPAFKAWNEKRFENTAYFEPFYLKEFVATTSKKKLF